MDKNLAAMPTTFPARCPQCGVRLPAGTPGSCCPLCVPEDGEDGDSPMGRVLGDCEIFEEIGRGGMGVVWRGRQRGLNREVAVKTLPGGGLAGAEARGRFRTEALAAARLKHENIVAVYEVGEDDGLPFLVMELVHGRTLSAVIGGNPVNARQAALWLRDSALAVEHAHSRGVLHRDLKPSNIFIEPGDHGGRPRVMDFGLAKLTDADHGMTLSGSAMGSPAFMPPEQTRGGSSTCQSDVYGLGGARWPHAERRRCRSTCQSDVYGLGGILYSALTGRPPFHGESLATVLAQVQTQDTVPPRRLNASVPLDLETICLKCLEKSPARRYATAAALAEDLTRFLEGRPVLARPLGRGGQLVRAARRHPWQAAAALMGAALVAGVLLFLVWGVRTERRHTADLRVEKTATQLALDLSKIEGARSIIRLHQPDGRPRALEMMQTVLAGQTSEELRAAARDTALAALALPMAVPLPMPGEAIRSDDWTMSTGELSCDRWAFSEFHGRIQVRSLSTGETVSEFSTAPRKVTALIRFSTGGRWLAIRHRDELGIWDTTPGTANPIAFAARAWGPDRTFGLMHAAFAPDGSAVVWSDGAALVATALPTGREMARWTAPGGGRFRCDAVAFAPDGKSFALSHDSPPILDVRSWPSGEVLQPLTDRPLLPAEALAIAPGGRWIAAGDAAGRISLWRSSGSRQIDFRAHHGSVRALGFSADGRHLASCSEDGSLRVWDCVSDAPVTLLPWDASLPSFSRDGTKLGIGTTDGRPVLADLSLSPIVRSFRPEPAMKRPQHVSIYPDSQSLVCLSDEGAAEFSLPDGRLIRATSSVNPEAVLADPDGAGLFSAAPAGLTRWVGRGAVEVRDFLPAAEGGWAGLNASADGQWLAAWGRSQRAVVWPAGDRDGSRVREVVPPPRRFFQRGPLARWPLACRHPPLRGGHPHFRRRQRRHRPHRFAPLRHQCTGVESGRKMARRQRGDARTLAHRLLAAGKPDRRLPLPSTCRGRRLFLPRGRWCIPAARHRQWGPPHRPLRPAGAPACGKSGISRRRTTLRPRLFTGPPLARRRRGQRRGADLGPCRHSCQPSGNEFLVVSCRLIVHPRAICPLLSPKECTSVPMRSSMET